MKILVNQVYDKIEKKLDGKNYSIWNYKVTATINGQLLNCTLKSFTKNPIELVNNQEVECEVKQNQYNGRTWTDYIIKPEKKEGAVAGYKKGGYQKHSFKHFERLVIECWSLTSPITMDMPKDIIHESRIKLFEKILGVASILVDVESLKNDISNTEKVNQVFNETIPF